MSDFDNPAWIDDQLRGIPLPPGILARLREIAALGDPELDRALGDVPLPVGMLDRLRAISAEPISVGPMSVGPMSIGPINSPPIVSPPMELPANTRRFEGRVAASRVATHSPVGWQTDRFRWAGWAIAASLLAMIGGVVWVVHSREHAERDRIAEIQNNQGHQSNSSQMDRSQIDRSQTQNNQIAGEPIRATGDIAPKNSDLMAHPDSSDGHSNVGESGTIEGSGSNSETGSNDFQGFASSDHQFSAGDDLAQLAAAQRAVAQNGSLLAALPSSPLEFGSFIPGFSAQGVAGPRVKEYDLAFELRHGVHPFVVPGANAALRESRVPIWTGTASYELAWRMLLNRQLPPTPQMHAEDFLAAMDYRFPPPSGAPLAPGAPVGIRTAGGPSPWGAPGLGLLQIGVQAGQLLRNPTTSTNLILVVDGSSAMRVEGRWGLVRRALGQLSGQMLPADRVSLVIVNQKADVWLHAGNRTEFGQLLADWNRRMPGGSANVTAGIEAAEKLAAKGADSQAGNTKIPSELKSVSRVVLLTDAAVPLGGKPLALAKDLVKQSVAAGVSWDVINIRQDELLDEGWSDLAAMGGLSVRQAASSEDLYQRLLKALDGRSQVVASSVSLKVEFRPEAVVRYRLIGHDATGAGGLSGGPLEADLRSGQAATALYEVELAAEGPERVATVEVTWREPGSEQLFRTRQDVSRLEFAPSWRESALPLQLAALAAETGEILGGSPFTPSPGHSLEQVAELASMANPKLSERSSFQRLKQFLELARAVRQGNSAIRVDAP